MAEGDLLVTISGAALSLLFFENVRSSGYQMGFLLGEALEFIVKTYTDSDNQIEMVKTHINVESIVTCPLSDILYDKYGRINKEKLKDFVRDKSKQVIGWFRFRRNKSSLILTTQDRLLHKQFASHFSGGDSCKEEFFLTCLLNTSTSETGGTHKFRHVFLRRKRGMFEPIPLRINNLGDDASRHDGSDYKPTPARRSIDAPDGFTRLVKSLNLDLTRIDGLDSAMKIQKEANRYLSSLIPEVCKSDLEVAELEKQVRQLKTKITAQRLAKKAKVNGENCKIEKNSESVKGKENSVFEKTDFSQKNESSVKIGDNICFSKEHTSSNFQSVQSVLSNKTPTRNTAACIEKSVNPDKSRRSIGIPSEIQNMSQDPFVNMVSEKKMDVGGSMTSSRNRRVISDIATEPICQEASEICVGKGRGSGRVHEPPTPGMRKGRHTLGGVHRGNDRSSTPEQDSDVSSPQNSVVTPSSLTSKSYNQATKKSLDNSRNTLDI